MQNLLEGLNKQQCEAVKERFGTLLVLAGAGSGKTRVLTTRILNLIEQGAKPYEILAVTFTNKAAKEAEKALNGLVKELNKEENNAGKELMKVGMELMSIETKVLRFAFDILTMAIANSTKIALAAVDADGKSLVAKFKKEDKAEENAEA